MTIRHNEQDLHVATWCSVAQSCPTLRSQLANSGLSMSYSSDMDEPQNRISVKKKKKSKKERDSKLDSVYVSQKH